MARLIYQADGLDRIEGLQNHVNEYIYETCVAILVKFFGEDEEQN